MLSYSIKGKGPTWVFLHGFLESSTMWDFLPLDDLPIQQIKIDLPGHGLSSKVKADTIKEMAAAVHEVLVQLQIDNYIVVGHSMGAYVGLEMTNFSGLQHLVLLNSNCWTDTPQKKQDRLRVAHIVQHAKDSFIREAIPNLFQDPSATQNEITTLISEAKQMSAEAIAMCALAMRDRADFTEYVNQNPAKFTFIHGKYDRLVSVNELETKVPNCKKHFLDCGHMAHIEAKEEVMELLNEQINA